MGRPPCCDKSNVKKGPWTPEEDAKILAYVSNHGVGNWTLVPKKAGLNRCGKSCRLRWTNYLRPDLKHDGFSAEEEELIIRFHEAVGSRWSLIAKQLPGRTDNDVKNFWNTKVKKKLIKMGIDPITHKPVSQILSDYGNISNLINNQNAPSFNNSNTNGTSVTGSEPNSLSLPTLNYQRPGVLLQQVIPEDEAIPTTNDHFWSDYLLVGDPFWSSNNELEEEEEEREHNQSELQDSSSVSSNNSSHPTIHKDLPPRCCFSSCCKHNYYTDDSNNDYNHQVKIENRRRTVYRQGSAAEGETNKQYAAASSSSSAAAVNSFVESILDSDCKMRSEFPALLADESFEY